TALRSRRAKSATDRTSRPSLGKRSASSANTPCLYQLRPESFGVCGPSEPRCLACSDTSAQRLFRAGSSERGLRRRSAAPRRRTFDEDRKARLLRAALVALLGDQLVAGLDFLRRLGNDRERRIRVRAHDAHLADHLFGEVLFVTFDRRGLDRQALRHVEAD